MLLFELIVGETIVNSLYRSYYGDWGYLIYNRLEHTRIVL